MTQATGIGTTDIRQFDQELWTYLTGRGAVIEYAFDQMSVEVPKITGADSPRATWKSHGTVRIRTSDQDNPGAIGAASHNGASGIGASGHRTS